MLPQDDNGQEEIANAEMMSVPLTIVDASKYPTT
jgi:hypothetical protein